MNDEPQTLRDAHAAATARRPRSVAGMSEWLKFHQANARMYSEVDRWHHHELKDRVGFEERKAEEVAAQISLVKNGS
ncbi:AMED_5909 family protein [Amycolatopsis alba]|uniref:AMED_5909 family protein n=1 Tax=Amycolatopsis alba TaxID=76020 RepID=UPI00047CEFAD|nr:AMED_5909 family protein [Amycolatopsis alba]